MINSFHTTMRKILLLFVMLCLAQTAVKADTDLTAYDNVIFVSPATVGQKSGNEVNPTSIVDMGCIVRLYNDVFLVCHMAFSQRIINLVLHYITLHL